MYRVYVIWIAASLGILFVVYKAMPRAVQRDAFARTYLRNVLTPVLLCLLLVLGIFVLGLPKSAMFFSVIPLGVPLTTLVAEWAEERRTKRVFVESQSRLLPAVHRVARAYGIELDADDVHLIPTYSKRSPHVEVVIRMSNYHIDERLFQSSMASEVASKLTGYSVSVVIEHGFKKKAINESLSTGFAETLT